MQGAGAVWIYQRPGSLFNVVQTDQAVALALISVEGDVAKFKVSFANSMPGEPIAPGCVYRSDTCETVLEVHRIEHLPDDSLCATTLDGRNIRLPSVTLNYRPYWLPDAAQAVLQGPVGWTFRSYSERHGDDHSHDIFDWSTIGAGGIAAAWQFGDADRWVTPENFDRFILKDILGWRMGAAHPASSSP